ncbi:MAG: TonB-dependent receptor [Cytophagales bacterium]|nr:TonB-dependent receptor [Cytophagales bacterium]
MGYVQAVYSPLSWLDLTARLGSDYVNEESEEVYSKYSAENHFEFSNQGSYRENFFSKRIINTDIIASAKKKWNNDWETRLSFGHNLVFIKSSSFELLARQLYVDGIYDFSNTDLNTLERSRTDRLTQTIGAYFDGQIAFRDYVYLNLTGRNDWASVLPANNNSFFYPSASLSFVFTEPLGLSTNSVFPFGKFRISLAQVANIPAPYSTSTYFTQAGSGSIRGATPRTLDGTIGNPAIRPETANSFETGFDLRFLDNRFGLDLTYYLTRNINQIIYAQIPASTGFNEALVNGGTIKNEGIEIVARASLVKTKDFGYDISANFTAYESLVEQIDFNYQEVGGGAGFFQGGTYAVEGQPYGVLLTTNRIKRYGQSLADQSIRNDLPMVVDDSLGYPVIEESTNQGFILGDPNPDWLMGLRQTLRYKNISLTALLDIRSGGKIWNLTRHNMRAMGTSVDTEDRDVLAVLPNSVFSDGQPNNVPIQKNYDYYTKFGDFGNVAELTLEDGSWVRLRELGISYELFEEDFVRIFGTGLFKSASVSFTGRNLWLWTNYTGVDPETNASGNDNSFGRDAYNQPNTRSYVFSLNLKF